MTAGSLTACEAAIVDLDGTMVDTLGDFDVVLNSVLRELGLPGVARAFLGRTIGKGSEHLIRSTLVEVGADAALYEPAWALYQQRYLDVNGDHCAVFDELGLPRVAPAFVALTIGKGSEHLIRSSIVEAGGSGADDALYERAWALYQQRYLDVNGDHSAVFPGVVEGLAMLQARGWKLACLTNKPTAFAEELLRRKGLRRHFAEVFGGDAFERRKPDPLPLLKTCAALGCAPASTLMVGDSSNDARAARAAGCPVVLVSYGYNHGEPVDAVDCDGVVDRLDHL